MSFLRGQKWSRIFTDAGGRVLRGEYSKSVKSASSFSKEIEVGWKITDGVVHINAQMLELILRSFGAGYSEMSLVYRVIVHETNQK
jgi:hypothetical protein